MIKRYANGKVSRSIHDGIESIEGLYGLGLELEQGINIIITGGTGVLPFLDLFDLLLKKAISELYNRHQNDGKYDPYSVNYCNVLKGMSFKLYASFATAEEFASYQWLIDLHRISKQHNLGLFELTLRVPKEAQLPAEVNRFESLIDQEFLHSRIPSREVSKVYVCGPPAMNTNLHQLLTAMNYSSIMVV